MFMHANAHDYGKTCLMHIEQGFKHLGCYSPPPLRKSRPEIRENTGPGLILGRDQGRHRVVKQTERKPRFIAYDLFTTFFFSRVQRLSHQLMPTVSTTVTTTLSCHEGLLFS